MPTEPSNDRREGKRVALNCPVRIILCASGRRDEFEALLLDASDRGVCLIVHVEIRIGDEIEILPREGPAFLVRGRVVWLAEFRARHEIHLGVHFPNPHAIPSWRG